MRIDVICAYQNNLIKAILIGTLNIPCSIIFIEYRKDIPKLFPPASWPGAMINPQWFELAMPRTNFHSPKIFESLKYECKCFERQEII